MSKACIVSRQVAQEGYLRIGELSRRTGVSHDLLRAWEQRYGLLHPARSAGGFRLYSTEDRLRVGHMVEAMAAGLSAAEAARVALATAATVTEADALSDKPAPRALEHTVERLTAALDSFDGAAANAALDELLAGLTLETVLQEVLLPYLRSLGDRWAAGTTTVGNEHFASNLIRGRLMGLARGWDLGEGPRVLLACPAGETHDLGLIMFGLVIARRGWNVTYLGADTPLPTLIETARRLRPTCIVLAVTTTAAIRSHAEEIAELAKVAPVQIGGEVSDRDIRAVGGTVLQGDPVAAARSLSA